MGAARKAGALQPARQPPLPAHLEVRQITPKDAPLKGCRLELGIGLEKMCRVSLMLLCCPRCIAASLEQTPAYLRTVDGSPVDASGRQLPKANVWRQPAVVIWLVCSPSRFFKVRQARAVREGSGGERNLVCVAVQQGGSFNRVPHKMIQSAMRSRFVGAAPSTQHRRRPIDNVPVFPFLVHRDKPLRCTDFAKQGAARKRNGRNRTGMSARPKFEMSFAMHSIASANGHKCTCREKIKTGCSRISTNTSQAQRRHRLYIRTSSAGGASRGLGGSPSIFVHGLSTDMSVM